MGDATDVKPISRLRGHLLALCATALMASLAFADPAVRVRYFAGVPQVELDGSYPQTRYTVTRSSTLDGPRVQVTQNDVLCMGSCYVQDFAAEPGKTYWYRFELVLADGSIVRFGPYAVRISPDLAGRVRVAITPNPVRAGARIELGIAGQPGDAPMRAEAIVVDLQGRLRRTLLRGDLTPGTTAIEWDGTDDAGRRLPSGTYFVRLRSPLGERAVRLIRTN
jgi:hypothetical protein